MIETDTEIRDESLTADLRDAWSDLRVRAFQAKVLAKRAMSGWCKRHRRAYRKARNLRRLALLVMVSWLAYMAVTGYPVQTATAATGLAGMALARMVPRKAPPVRSSRSKRQLQEILFTARGRHE
jgi:hypothetical protein